MQRIISSFVIVLVVLLTGVCTPCRAQLSQPAVVCKILPVSGDQSQLSIALSFTNIAAKPSFEGVRIISGLLSTSNKRTAIGFSAVNPSAYDNPPLRTLMLGDEEFTYWEADADGQENGMFRLMRTSTEYESFHLTGVFFAQGHLFVIDKSMIINEGKIIYSN
jgi:hypothetical protein